MNDASDDAIAEALWGKVSDDLDSDGAHLALVEHFRGRGQLGEAARRYRDHQSGLDPDGDEEAKAQIDKRLKAIGALAFAQLDVTRTEPEPRSLALNLLMVVVGLICIAAVAGLLKALLS
jgi:hypothetical protein